MSYKIKTNIFSELEDEVITIKPASLNFRRKAEKKLREIEILQDKRCDCPITIEEIKKINEKTFWQSVLYHPKDPKYKDIYFKQTKKENEKLEKEREKKRIKEQDRKLKEEQDRKLKEEQDRKLKEEQDRKLKEEQKEYDRKFREEQEDWDRKFREKNNLYSKEKNKHSSKLELEYKIQFLKNNNNNDKTFRQLSLKYHPDKNIDKQEWAQKKQQELSDIRNKFEL